MLRKSLAALAVCTALMTAGQTMAAEYTIDKEGQHAFIDFTISHLGYSFIHGTFRDWSGTFSFDAARPEDSKVNIKVRVASLFTNHAERDKHLIDKDYLDARTYPDATFVSTKVEMTGKNAEGKLTADVTGDLSLHGVTRSVVIKSVFNGEGKDPWGGYRAGFNGTTSIKRTDFGKMKELSPQSDAMVLNISFEGIRNN